MTRAIGAILAISAFCLWGIPARAENAGVMIIGIGRSSCATWLSTRETELEGSSWFLGFWTGNNLALATPDQPGMTGNSSDPNGLIGELKRRCTENPSSTLINEASQMFRQFRHSRR